MKTFTESVNWEWVHHHHHHKPEDGLIGCQAGDCCLRREADGWRYARNRKAYPTPVEAYEHRHEV